MIKIGKFVLSKCKIRLIFVLFLISKHDSYATGLLNVICVFLPKTNMSNKMDLNMTYQHLWKSLKTDITGKLCPAYKVTQKSSFSRYDKFKRC